LVNINSQIVQVFGFIRLGRMPKARKGAEAIPRKGTGTCICCQQPWHILARTPFIRVSPRLRPSRTRRSPRVCISWPKPPPYCSARCSPPASFVTRGVDGWQSLVEKPFPRVSLQPAVVLSRPDVASEKMSQSRDGPSRAMISARPVIRALSSQRLNSTLSSLQDRLYERAGSKRKRSLGWLRQGQS
jgi:hypothetical protein